MKKFLLTTLSLVMAVAVYAGTYTLTTNSSASTWTGDVNGYTTTINGWTLTYEKANSTSDCVEPKSDHIRVYKNARFTIAPASSSSETIVKVVLSCTASNYAATPSTDSGSVSASGTTVTWEGSANQVVLNATGSQLRIKTIEITTAADGAVLAPSITPNGGEYVTGDKVNVTIKGAAGQDLYYTLNSDDIGEAEEYTGETIEITSNTTVYAWASNGTTTSEAATATFNFTAPLGNIAAFNALDKGKAVKFISPLTAVYQNGSNLIVKDDSGTMLIYGNVEQTYNNGDIIAAGMRGLVGEYGGNKQLSPNAESFTAGVAGTAVVPVKKTVAELASCAFLDYVKLEGVYFTLDEGKTRNYTVSDGTNSFAAYNQFYITIEGLAEGVTYNVEGFVSSYNGNAQLQPTSVTVADASGITGESSVNETFNSALPTNWYSATVAGDKSWYAGSYGSNYYAAMTGYKGTAPFEAWFISPALNVKDAEKKTVSFKTQVNGYGATTTEFKVYVLNGTDPTTATKTELNATLAVAPESGYSEWAESGEIDLSSYGDLVYVGFCYTATTDANYATWCVDDFLFNAVAEVPEELGTKESPITVAQAKAAYVDGEQKAAWVTGYIVGCLEGSVSKALFGLPTETNTNIIIADAADCKDVDLCIPVELPKGTVRSGLNLVDNPTNLGKKVILKCNIEKYFSIAGLKGASEYVLEGSSAIEVVDTDENAPVEYYNLQGVKVENPAGGIFIKKQAGKTTKVVL